ncbi:hypothetical protein [Streptomyces sp. NPDC052114]|uniref:hypothetical protein n=1 Tax=unclassified Streptomyces TaxID=2593676 RepID=UPI00341E7E20
MTRQLTYAHALTATAVLLSVAGIWTGAVTTWWMSVFGLYGAAFLAYCARREYAIHRQQRLALLFGKEHETASTHCTQGGDPQ